MTQQAVQAERSRPSAEGFSAWWWLGLPLATGLLLLASARLWPKFNDAWIEGEQGLLELSHVVIPLAALVIALRILAMGRLRGRPWLTAWVALAALACFYIAGEEASWGQQFLQWKTPDGWREINDQQETNLHNVSSWFDQKPRSLLELGVIVGGIILPIAALLRPGLRRGRFAIILPPFLCLPSAVLAELARLPERLADHLEIQDQLFTRASEVQEFYFYLFVLFYLIVLRQRLTAPKEGM